MYMYGKYLKENIRVNGPSIHLQIVCKIKNSPWSDDVLKLTHILSIAKFIKCLNKDVCQCTSCAKNEAEKRKLFANGMDL